MDSGWMNSKCYGTSATTGIVNYVFEFVFVLAETNSVLKLGPKTTRLFFEIVKWCGSHAGIPSHGVVPFIGRVLGVHSVNDSCTIKLFT